MSGLHQSELNDTSGSFLVGARGHPETRRAEGSHSESMSDGKLLTLKEAADLLQLSEEEVRDFVAQGKIPAYKLGGKFLRFKKEQIEALRERIQILKWKSALESSAVARDEDKGVVRYSAWERIRDFVYFNDFYFIAVILIAILLFIVFKYR